MTTSALPDNVSVRLGFLGCAHLGYQMANMARLHPSGLNIREVDGYATYELVMADMIAKSVQAISNGGDVFHFHNPKVRPANEYSRTDAARVAAGIPVVVNGGNHDSATSNTVSAVALTHLPDLGSFAVFPDAGRPAEEACGPHPGLYEVHQPIPGIPVYLHVVSHSGLDPKLAERGIHIEPAPIPESVNILVAHGIFSADGRLFGADDRHGVERVIPEEWANRGWDHSILSDYHTPGPIPGFGEDGGRGRGQVWMTGSLIGRGFSDDICSRGWLMVDLTTDGRVTITPQYVWRRPQIDFDVIDARGRTVEEINTVVRERLAAQSWWDPESESVSGDGGYLLRQKISHASPAQRRGIRALAGEWAVAAGRAAYWGFAFEDPLDADETVASKERRQAQRAASGGRRTLTFGQDFLDRMGDGRVAATLTAMPDQVRNPVVASVSSALGDLMPTAAQ